VLLLAKELSEYGLLMRLILRRQVVLSDDFLRCGLPKVMTHFHLCL